MGRSSFELLEMPGAQPWYKFWLEALEAWAGQLIRWGSVNMSRDPCSGSVGAASIGNRFGEYREPVLHAVTETGASRNRNRASSVRETIPGKPSSEDDVATLLWGTSFRSPSSGHIESVGFTEITVWDVGCQ